jgi:hypothetical protein
MPAGMRSADEEWEFIGWNGAEGGLLCNRFVAQRQTKGASKNLGITSTRAPARRR